MSKGRELSDYIDDIITAKASCKMENRRIGNGYLLSSL